MHSFWDKEETKMETIETTDFVDYQIGNYHPERPEYYLYLKRKHVLGAVYLWKLRRRN